MRFITLVSLSTFAVVARASLATEIGSLLRRQSPTSPSSNSACDSICAPFQSSLNTCATSSCLCTATVASSLQDCINCAVAASPADNVLAAAQTLRDTFQSTCSTYGLLPITIPAVPGATAALGGVANPVGGAAGPTTASGPGMTTQGFFDANPTATRASSTAAAATVSAGSLANQKAKTSGASTNVRGGLELATVAGVAAGVVLFL